MWASRQRRVCAVGLCAKGLCGEAQWCAAHVTLGDEHHDEGALLDVGLERANVLEVVDVKEDGDAGQKQAELPLDCRALVLCRAMDGSW